MGQVVVNFKQLKITYAHEIQSNNENILTWFCYNLQYIHTYI